MAQLDVAVLERPITFRSAATLRQPPRPRPIQRIVELDTLQVIIKTVERCNLACSYCYYFSMGDESFSARRPIIGEEVCERIPGFLLQGVEALKIRHLAITFHGGEPTLQRLRDFDRFCTALVSTLAGKTRLTLGMQTNGLYLPDEWLACLDKHRVQLCVSLDGPAEYHDKFRTDAKGRGSYGRIAANVARANDYFVERGANTLPSISVMNHLFDARKTCLHLRDALGIRKQSYLLPDRSCDHPWKEGESAERYGEQLIALFDAFVEDQGLVIFPVEEVLAFFQETTVVVEPRQLAPDEAYGIRKVMVLQSNGEVSVDDSLIAAQGWRSRAEKLTIFGDSVEGFVNSPASWELHQTVERLPDACQPCRWRKLCKGGYPAHRYSEARGFNNPSAYCGGLKMLYEHVVAFLIKNGYPAHKIAGKLGT
jgi:uncharacterized protein